MRDRTDLAIYTPEPYPMPTAGETVGRALQTLVESRGIRLHTGHKVTQVDPIRRRLAFANGASAAFDLLIGVPPHRAPRVVRESGLLGTAAWVPADPATLRTARPEVYAIGDVAAVPIAGGKMLPKAGVFAHAQAEVVAENIARELAGRAPTRRFDGHGWCAVETGNGRAAWGSGNFYAPAGPDITLHPPARRWHWGKVAFERWWLWRWF